MINLFVNLSNINMNVTQVLEDNKDLWGQAFPEWIGTLMECIADYSGTQDLFPVDQV